MERTRFRTVLAVVLTSLTVPQANSAAEVVWARTFGSPDDLAACSIAEGLKATVASDGEGVLSLVGTVKGSRNAGVLACKPLAVRPRHHYRATCRIKVDRYDVTDFKAGPVYMQHDSVPPVFLALRLSDREGRTLAPPRRGYDMERLGAWQELAIDFFTIERMRALTPFIEKRNCTSATMAVLIDSLKLERVEAMPVPAWMDAEPVKVGQGGVAHRRLELSVVGWPQDVKTRWPVSSGIPLPKGELVDATHARLTDGVGSVRPCQTEAPSRWDDGSIRWLLVDAQVAGDEQLVLHYGRGVSPPALRSALTIEERPSRVIVDTGPLRFAVERRGFDLFDRVVCQGAEIMDSGDRLTLTTADGIVHRAAGDRESRVRVVRRGPLHGVVEGRGWLVPSTGEPRFAYVARIDAFESLDSVGLALTFINKSDQPAEQITSVSVGLPFAAAVQGWELCGVKGEGVGWCHQDQHDHWGASSGAQGKRSKGQAVLSLAGGVVGLAARDWWQNYPKAFDISGKRLSVELWPRRHPKPYRSRQGESKTHEMLLRFAPSGSACDDAFALFDAQPQLAAAPEWNCASKVVGDVIPAPGSPWPWFDVGYGAAIDAFFEKQERKQCFGMRDFGDWARRTANDWDNNSRDMALSLFQQYLRTGEIRYFRLGRQIVLHQMDIDTIHHCTRRPDWIGATYMQAINPDHSGHGPSTTFTYIGGELLFGYLTGHGRAYELARGTADYVAGRVDRGAAGYGSERDSGWPLATMMEMYEASWERKYLARAEQIVSCVAARANARHGGTPRPIYEHQSKWGGCSWMSGCLMYSLRRYHLRTGDERARDALLKIADFLVDVIWRPELGGFLAKESRRYTPTGRPNQRSIVGLPYAYRLNPRQKYLDVFAENQAHVRRIVGPGLSSQQKAFAWATRFPPLSWYDYTQIGAPIAHAGDDVFLSSDLTVELNGSGSYALGMQSIAKYEWRFGDGQKGEGVRPAHRYAKPGDYTATLTVTTASGASARDTVRVRHLPPGNYVLNGGFEEDADGDGRADHWDLRVDGSHATVALDGDVAHSGRRSVRIEAAGRPAIVHVFQLNRPLPPGRKYVLSCWLRMTEVGKIDEPGMRTGTYLIAYPRPQLVWRCASPGGPDIGTIAWRKYETRFTSKPTDRSVDVYCKLRRCTGTAWFDDIWLRPAE